MSLPSLKNQSVWCIGWLTVLGYAAGCTSIPNAASPVAARKPVAAPDNQRIAAMSSMSPPRSTRQSVSNIQPQSDPIEQVGFRHHVSAGNANGFQSGPCADPSYGHQPIAGNGVTAMPLVPAAWYYDPQEFLCDGGDQNPPVAVTRDEQIIGLQPEDTVAIYTTEGSEIDIAPSNRVCVYSPRFGNVRRITGAILSDRSITVSGVARPVGPQGIDYDLPGLVVADAVEVDRAEYTRRIDSMRDRNRGVRIESIQQIEMAGDSLAVLANIRNLGLSQIDESQLAIIQRLALAANEWTIDESVEIEISDLAAPVLTRDQTLDALVVYEFPDAGRLNLIKLADKQHAAIGDEVTFALRLQNVGDSTVTGVIITDNLTTRLEYVDGSETASVKAEFKTRPNEAGSAQLVWELKDSLAVGQSVTIEFKCRVR